MPPRPQRNMALSVVMMVALIALGPRLPGPVMSAVSVMGMVALVSVVLLGRVFFRGRSLMGEKKWDEAATAMAAFELEQSSSPWRRRLAFLYLGFYSYDGVAVARNNLGAIRLEQERLEDAQRHFERALESDPLYAIPWANLAVLGAKRGDRARVEACRARAHELGFRRRGFQKILDELLSKASVVQNGTTA